MQRRHQSDLHNREDTVFFAAFAQNGFIAFVFPVAYASLTNEVGVLTKYNASSLTELVPV
jgi:hypothetical protein